MTLILFMLSALALTSAQQYCCAPKQFKITLFATSGIATTPRPFWHQQRSFVLYDDVTYHRQAVITHFRHNDHDLITFRAITDIPSRTVYEIDESKETCVTRKISPDVPLSTCLNNQYHYMGENRVGQNVLVDIWKFDFAVASENTTYNTTVFIDKAVCLPVSQSIAFGSTNPGSRGGVIGHQYTDSELVLQDYDMPKFEIPTFCNKTASAGMANFRDVNAFRL